MRLTRRPLLTAAALATALAATGCATLNQLPAEVSSYGEWPAGRAPGRYAFDPMPSQQAQATQQAALEAALKPVLAKAGFQPVEPGQAPDVLVQAGARVSRLDRSPWDDPLWWHGGFGSWRPGPWRGPVWGPGWGVSASWRTSPRYEREVAVLLRDRASGKPLYEARASSEGYSSQADELLRPLFAAAMTDFPAALPKAHDVRVPLGNPAP